MSEEEVVVAPTNVAGGPLLEPHAAGCRCWPHVSQGDAYRAVEHAALVEYRDGLRRPAADAEIDVERLARAMEHACDRVGASVLYPSDAAVLADEYTRLASEEAAK